MGVGAAPQNPNNIFWHRAIETRRSEVSKNTFAGLWGTTGMGVWGATAEPKQMFLIFCSSNTPILGIQIIAGLLDAWVFGAPPQNPNDIFWHCAVQTAPS